MEEEEEYSEVRCRTCGNVIKIRQIWREGFKYNDDIVITCDDCGREFEMPMRDRIEIEGGGWKYKGQ